MRQHPQPLSQQDIVSASTFTGDERAAFVSAYAPGGCGASSSLHSARHAVDRTLLRLPLLGDLSASKPIVHMDRHDTSQNRHVFSGPSKSRSERQKFALRDASQNVNKPSPPATTLPRWKKRLVSARGHPDFRRRQQSGRLEEMLDRLAPFTTRVNFLGPAPRRIRALLILLLAVFY